MEEEAAHILADAKKMCALKGGNLVLPTYDELLEATSKAERESVEAPLREAEASIAKLIAVGARDDKVSYARINAAVYRKKLEWFDDGEDDYIDP